MQQEYLFTFRLFKFCVDGGAYGITTDSHECGKLVYLYDC